MLPDKTLAVRAGIGWIGKNNRLVTRLWGAAQCLGAVPTDAPLKTDPRREPLPSRCGSYTVCVEVCEKNVLHGTRRAPGTARGDAAPA